jgi:hypothetical protein
MSDRRFLVCQGAPLPARELRVRPDHRLLPLVVRGTRDDDGIYCGRWRSDYVRAALGRRGASGADAAAGRVVVGVGPRRRRVDPRCWRRCSVITGGTSTAAAARSPPVAGVASVRCASYDAGYIWHSDKADAAGMKDLWSAVFANGTVERVNVRGVGVDFYSTGPNARSTSCRC